MRKIPKETVPWSSLVEPGRGGTGEYPGRRGSMARGTGLNSTVTGLRFPAPHSRAPEEKTEQLGELGH